LVARRRWLPVARPANAGKRGGEHFKFNLITNPISDTSGFGD
jgi:hypothetical protein